MTLDLGAATRRRLEVGIDYEAIGPAHGSKLGPPQRVTIVEADEDAQVYRTAGARQVAKVIRFDCEHFWRPVGL